MTHRMPTPDEVTEMREEAVNRLDALVAQGHSDADIANMLETHYQTAMRDAAIYLSAYHIWATTRKKAVAS